MEWEQMRKNPLSETMAKNLLEHIILLGIRHGKRKCCETKEGADKIQEVVQYISENYALETTLQDAAARAYMEKTYFSKKFKQLTGFGFKEYLVCTRIQAAERMLATSGIPVNEVSDACGFSSSNYFGDVFKRMVGVSPLPISQGR